MIGQTIDHFRLVAQLGEDNRSDVWEAEDTRIGRRVAIKFLHEGLAKTDLAIERFKREAELASQLSHPNLCSILDVGNHDDRPYVVMELLDGKSLKEAIATNSPSLTRAISWMQQLAEALDALHSHSMLQWDLNPSNIFITSRNQLKVLDIGLGRLTQSTGQSHPVDFIEARDEEDYELKETTSGRFDPSIHYLSPEQIRGLRPDHRADLFSFGVILYELLTGVRPFAGNSPEMVSHNILNNAITHPSAINPYISDDLDRLTLQLLENDRDLRCQSASELMIDLERIHHKRPTSASLTIPAAVEKLRRSTVTFRALVATGACLAILVAIFLPPMPNAAESEEHPLAESPKTPIVVPLTASFGAEIYPVLSPLGNQIAYSWNNEDKDNTDIYIRLLNSEHPLRLTTNSGRDVHPCWSPDGNQIAFIRRHRDRSEIVITSAIGGNETVIYSNPSDIRGVLDWSPDGKSIAFDYPTENGSAIAVIDPRSHAVTMLTSSETAFLRDHSPAFSPDGTWLAFVRTIQGLESEIFLKSLIDDTKKQLTFDGRSFRGIDWSPDSQELVYSSNRNGPYMLWRHRILAQNPQLVAGTGLNATYPSTSSQENLLVHTIVHEQIDIVRTRLGQGDPNETAAEEYVPTSTSLDYAPKISPDGKQLLYISERTGFPEIWIANTDGTNPQQVTSLRHPDLYMPTWSPDGTTILFRSHHFGYKDMYYVAATGGRVHDASGPEMKANSAFWALAKDTVHLRTGGENSRIFKYNFKNGDTTLITDDSGTAVWQHPAGESLFLAKYQRGRPRIYELLADGSSKALDQKIIYTRSYGIETHAEGIYFSRPSYSSPPNSSVYYYDFGREKVEKVATAPLVRYSNFGFSISPDGKWLYYAKQTKDETDIIVVENYR